MSKKPTLVMVPGMFCHAGMYEKLKGYLEEAGYPCKALTLPCHTTKLSETPSLALGKKGIEDYVEHVVAEVERLGDFVLIGHSMGGLISMLTAAQENVKPRGLILLAPAAPAGVLALTPNVIRTFWPIMSKARFWEIPVALDYKNVRWAMFNELGDEAISRQVYEQMVWESGYAAFQMGFWVVDYSNATKLDPSAIKCPVSIFAGTKDRTTPFIVVKTAAKVLAMRPTVGQRLWSLVRRRPLIASGPPVKFIRLKGLGHWLLLELAPAEVLKEIERF